MEDSWVTVFKTSDLFEANIVRGKLEWENITCNILNKKDSAYGTFGYIEVRVPLEFLQLANEVLNIKNIDPKLN